MSKVIDEDILVAIDELNQTAKYQASIGHHTIHDKMMRAVEKIEAMFSGPELEVCPRCGGDGHIVDFGDTCYVCKGTGKLPIIDN